MLVLTRKTGESIQIGDNVTVEILEMRGGRVRLGINAPGDVSIQRRELLLTIPIRNGRDNAGSVSTGSQFNMPVPVGS